MLLFFVFCCCWFVCLFLRLLYVWILWQRQPTIADTLSHQDRSSILSVHPSTPTSVVVLQPARRRNLAAVFDLVLSFTHPLHSLAPCFSRQARSERFLRSLIGHRGGPALQSRLFAENLTNMAVNRQRKDREVIKPGGIIN